jgi:branched-chain amino acid aminotransferase
MEALHYYNGQYLKKHEIHISPDDVGFLRGHGVFDFFRVEQGVPIFIEDHLDRLEASAKGFNIPMPMSRNALKEIIAHLIEANDYTLSSIKVILTGGLSVDGFSPSNPTILVLHQPFEGPDPKIYEIGASLMLYQYHRDFPTVKSTQYAKALALQVDWKTAGHIDVLYHDNELISEVSRSSVFLFKNGVLKTNRQNVLKGITQTNVIRAVEGHYPIDITDIKLEEVWAADELFITSTTKKVLPIVKVGEDLIAGGEVGEQTKHVKDIFNNYLADYITQHQL